MPMTDYGGGTATIHQFPVGGRSGLARREAEKQAVEAALRAPRVDFGSWYHQEAVEAATTVKPGSKS